MLSNRRSRTAWLMVMAVTLTWGLYVVNLRSRGSRDNSGACCLEEEAIEKRNISANISENKPSTFLIRTPGCSILKYPTFSKGVIPFLETGKPKVDCILGDKKGGLILPGPPIKSNSTHVYISKPFKAQSCCYISVKREIGKIPKWVDNSYSTSKECESFPGDGSTLEANSEKREFMKLKCKVEHEGKHYSFVDFHAFPIPKEGVEKRCEENSAQLNSEEKKERLNLIIIGLDATSRLNFHRQFPETRQFLVEMGAVELTGYNKVADNTFPNVVPLMTGHSEKELKSLCWPRRYDSLDNCPWIWKKYVEQGYRTMLVEDSPNIGIFNFERLGFREQPSDYYARPFILAAENSIGHYNYPTVLLCLGHRLATEVVLDYTSKFTDVFFGTKHPSFVFAWSTTMTHDGLALGREADPVVARHMRRILTPEARPNTALLFISDHGVRAGEFRQTPQGSQEERLPYAFLVLPPSYKKRYPQAMANLQLNGRHRLTSPFDLHYTLLDLLTPGVSLSQQSIAMRSKNLASTVPLPRGISLFLPVPETRKCNDADINRHWCTCVDGKVDVPRLPEPVEALKAGKALVRSINSLLQKDEEAAKKCATLDLADVMEARSTGDGTLLVTVKTNPGGAVFEGTMGMEIENNKVEIEESVSSSIRNSAVENDGVSFGVSRLNRYGNQSACIGDYHLKLYCYCINQISTREGRAPLKAS